GPAPLFPLKNDDPCHFMYGDGSLLMTARHLAMWTRVLTPGLVFNRASIQKILAPGLLKNKTSTGYGYGLFIQPSPAGLVVTHSGGWLGFSNNFHFNLNSGLLIVVLGNSESVPIFEVTDELVAEFGG
ncbi:MAG: serine hydrolase, partial [Bdellovibrionales bacterium]|nr:serine hydrolase [Bdellovibrionales bacterium]